MQWDSLAERVLEGDVPTREEAFAVLRCGDDEIQPLLEAAFKVRSHYFGRDVHIHVLQNAKSGACPEDCGFCSQSSSFNTGVDSYRMQSVEELVAAGRAAHEKGAARYCMVTATRGPSNADLKTVCEAVRQIKEEMPEMQICTSLGVLDGNKASQLAEAGVDRYNHNLETSKRFFPSVVSTHTYEDRENTVRTAIDAGMEACCGGIVGMGENEEDRVEMAFALRELAVSSIPVNFLDPREGTPMETSQSLTPEECLRVLALFRFVNPSRDLRIAGGREVNLGEKQAMALYAANSLFAEGYLTTSGQGYTRDRDLIEGAGFQVVEVID